MASPYDKFIEALMEDESPNFLWYTLCILEKHAYAGESECLRAIREVMEKKYNIVKDNPFRLQ